jgi:hypothetical protein
MPSTSFEAFPDPAEPVKVLTCHGHPAHAVGLRFGRSFADSSCLYLTPFQARTVLRQLAALYPPADTSDALPAPDTAGAEVTAAAAHPLDEAWRAIDALGGWFNRANPEAAAYDRALGDAVRAVEALGGMDPARRTA